MIGPSLAELARRFGTPLYVYRLDEVRRAVTGLRAALPDGVDMFYAVKANPHPAIISAAAAECAGLEISSVGELDAVLRAAVSVERCLYSGPAKTPAEIECAVRAGVRLFSVESEADADRLASAAVDYLVRLNIEAIPGAAGLRMSGGSSQFGVAADRVDADSPLWHPSGLARPVGLHMFSATNARDEAALLADLEANLTVMAETARRVGFRPRLLDLGGGFAAPFAAPGPQPVYPALRARLAAALDLTVPGWRSAEPRIAVESGRHLVAAAGTLVTRVMDRRTSGGREYVICDAGVNTLGGMSGLGRLLPAVQPAGPLPDAATAVLVGPLCTPLDVLSRAARVGAASAGDLLVVPNVGAYGLTASLLAFLGRPMAAEVVLDGDEIVGARRLSLVETDLLAAAD